MAVEKMANNSSKALVEDILDALAALDGVKGYEGDVTITDEVNLEQLTKLNKATTGAITLNLAVDFVGTSTEILTAIAGDINFANGSSVTITNPNYTLAQLNTIADAGVTTTTVSNTSVALSGSVADLAVLGDIANYSGVITVTGNYKLADLQTIDTYTTGTIKVANTSVALNGGAADLAAMLPTLAGYKGAVTVNDAITLAELKAINNATTGAITLAADHTAVTLSGSAADILAAFKGIKSYEGAITVTGTDYKLADLKAINAITDGALTVTTSTVALTGTAKDLVAALDGVTTYAGKVTVTGSYTVDDLKDINDAVSGNTVLANKNVALTGKIADIKDALAGISDYAGAIKLTDVPADTAELISVANLTKGKITLPANGYIDLEGTAAVLQPLLAKINGAYKNDVTVTALDNVDAVKALAQLKAINDATTGNVTVTTPSPLKGSIKDIHAALKGITGFNAGVTVTDTKYTLAQLKTIVDSMDVAGTLILDVNAPLSGSVEDLTAVLAKVPNTYAGDITVTGKPSLAELIALNAQTTGAIKVANTSVALKGTAGDLETVLKELKGYKGAVTVNDALTDLDQLLAINNATTGAITLVDQTTNLSGSAADILAAFKGIKSYATGDITVDDTDYKLADLKAINAITTDGALIVTKPIALTGSAKDLAAALNGVAYGDKVTVTGSYTVADLKTINAAVGPNDLVLANKKVALTGTAADIKLALAGITDYEGAIKVTDSSISEADLKAINDLTEGKITLPTNGHADLAGTVSEVIDLLQGITGYKGTVTVTVGANTTLAQLKTITNSLANKAVFNTTLPATTTATNLEGTAKDITAVLNKFDNKYAGNLEVTGSYTLADLVALNKLLDDANADITLDNTINLSGKSADIAAALKNVNGYDGKITLTDKPTVAQLVAINAATTEAIKIPTDTALSGAAADIIAALNGVEGHKGNITVSGTPTAADVNTIAGLTTGVVRATIATGAVKATLDAIAKVDANDIITFTTNDTSVDASDLVALKAKVDNLTTTTVNTITEAAANIGTSAATIKAALAIAPNKAVTIIDGNISAADLDIIANETNGVVTANISAGTVAATLAAITHVDANDIITYTTNQATVDASDLVALKAKVDTFNTASVTKITEAYNTVDLTTVVLAAEALATGANVEITGGAISAANLNILASDVTIGNITATITDGAVAATLTAISNVNAADTITFKTNDTTVDASDLVDLKVKVDTFDTASVTTITEAAANIGISGATVVSALNIAGNDTAVTITTAPILAADADAIADATSGVVTAAVAADAASALNAALLDATVGQTVVNAYTLTVSAGTAAAADLNGLDAKTSVAVDASAVTAISGSSADVAAAYAANTATTISGLGNETVNITGTDATVANVAAINTATTGLVTVSEVNVTAGTFSLANLGDLAGITGLATIDATDTAVSAISLNLADLFASNDNAIFNIAVKLGAEDTLNLLATDAWVKSVDANGNGTYTNGTQVITVTGSDDNAAVVIA